MKIIEAMKKAKDLQVKADDIKKKVSTYCAIQSFETPMYGDSQRSKISEWLQAHGDIVKEILRLRVAVQRTNLATKVSIDIGGKSVEKTIAEWIHRRRDLAELDRSIWGVLSDRGLKEGVGQNSQGEKMDIKVIRFFDPKEKDEKMELYRSEPSIIDSTLEVVNAVTDIIE